MFMEPVCALDYRYGRKEMKELMSYQARVMRCLQVEAALARAHAEVGNIPREAADEISRKANLDHVTLERVEEIESEISHDIMAIVNALTEQCDGKAGRYVHLGATSYDIVDTALALQMKDALDLIDTDLHGIEEALMEKAGENRDLVMLGRTHGQYAVPITLGLKMSVWLAEFHRHRERLRGSRSRVLVGKMSGAVGTGAALGGSAFRIEELVMKGLGIGKEEAATQIVQRDRMTEMFSHLCNISVTVEKIATEIRNLQRSEIGELAEPFDEKKQVGSSTMSHKRNPIICENVTGLARTIRGFLIPAFENGVQWNERDLANSSSERFILPHMMVLTDEILIKITQVIRGLVVNKDRIGKNIAAAGDVIMAESMIMALVEKGMGRQEAHEATRKAAMRYYSGTPYRTALFEDSKISDMLSIKELEKALDPASYVGVAGERVDRVIEMVRSSPE
ncbi:MAG: adenylosuccinate lyase [Candidatus Thermoplasmatota archaeon]|nr:adenylosuccinate lyase [Candidatus Thermoplasmatota archaeon]